jgi:hypothetical protein
MITRIPDASTIAGWRKSSYSGAQGDCVEVARLGDEGVALRDSKNPGGPVLAFSRSPWRAFLGTATGSGFPA